jgi:hypothetical protein
VERPAAELCSDGFDGSDGLLLGLDSTTLRQAGCRATSSPPSRDCQVVDSDSGTAMDFAGEARRGWQRRTDLAGGRRRHAGYVECHGATRIDFNGWINAQSGVGCGPKTGTGVGRCGVGDKNITFLAETLSKLRFLWSFHLFVIMQPYGWVRCEG